MPKVNAKGEVRLSALEEDVLTCIVEFDGSGYGLKILEVINAVGAKFNRPQIGIGSLYPVLTRLVRYEFATTQWGEEENERRKYYKATKEGVAILVDTDLYRCALENYFSEVES